MKKIIAIGGGEIGRPGHPVQTIAIDNEIIRLTGKKNPKLLFIPTASGDSETYYESVQKHFGKRLGCKTDVLYLVKDKPSVSEIEKKILGADIIYVGGGNTLYMMIIWRKLGIDRILKRAYNKGIVMSGLSAGSVCWFKYGNSDSRMMNNPKANYIKVSGLGFINTLHCPHYDTESKRRPGLKKMTRKMSGVAIALDNCAAIEVLDDKFRIISSKPSANGYKVFWKAGEYHEVVVKKDNQFRSLKELLSM